MITDLEDFIADKTISKTDKLLLILYHMNAPLSTAKIREIAIDHGWRSANDENFGSFLRASKFISFIKGHWKLNAQGKSYLSERGYIKKDTIITPIIINLEQTINSIKAEDNKRFLSEALECLKINSYRSAIVFSWVGAIYLLQKYVFERHLKKFNAEIPKHYPREKINEEFDEFIGMKDSKFLVVTNKIKVISENEYKELKSCLDRRNEAGHPNTTIFDDLTTAHHVSQLSKTIFAKFS